MSIRPGEERLVRLGSLLAFFALAMNLLVLATMTALFLGQRPRSDLPLAYAAAALFGVLAALGLTALSGRIARIREAALVFISLALVLIVAWAILPMVSSSYLFVFYPVCSALSALAVVQAFAVVSDCVDAEQAKRLLPVIGSGGTLGAVCAGAIIALLAPQVGTRALLLAGALAALAAVWLAVLLVRSHVTERAVSLRPAPDQAAPASSKLIDYLPSGLLSDPLILLFGMGQLVITVASTLLKFEFESAIQAWLEIDKIAVFLGVFNLAANASVLLVQTVLERPIVRRFGFSVGLASVPGVFVLAMPLLWLMPGLASLAAARFAEHVSRFSIARTAEDLVLLPLSSTKRRHVKTLTAGALVPIAILLTSCLIFLSSQLSPNVRTGAAWLCAGCGLWLAIAIRKPYLVRLQGELSKPRLTLDSLGAPTSSSSRAGIEAALEQTLREADPRRVAFALSTLAETKITIDPRHLHSLYQSPDPKLREATYVAAASTGNASWVDGLLEALAQEGDEAARTACARALCVHLPDERLGELDALLSDPIAGVRAEGLARRDTSEGLLSTDPELRRAALRAAGRTRDLRHLPLIVTALADRSVASTALLALREWPAEALVPALTPATVPTQPRALQKRAIRALGRVLHPSAAEALRQLLTSPSEDIQTAALRALSRRQRPGEAQRAVANSMHKGARNELRNMRMAQLACERLSREAGSERAGYARAELIAWSERCQVRMFLWFSLVHPAGEMLRTQLSLASPDRRARAFALEMLGQRLDASLGLEVTSLLNPAPGAAQNAALERGLGLTAVSTVGQVLALSEHSVCRSVARYLSPQAHPASPGEPTMSVLETMFVLRTVELFSRLSSEELRAVAELSQTKRMSPGEALFHEGDPGDAFYVIKTGQAEVSKNGKVLAVLRQGDWFGELALLDQGMRTATVVARADTELTCVAAADFHELLEEAPSIARAMLGVLAKRQSRLLDSQQT